MSSIAIIAVDLVPVVVVLAIDVPVFGLDVCIAFLPLPPVIRAQGDCFTNMNGDFVKVVVEIEQPVADRIRYRDSFSYIQPFLFCGIRSIGCTEVAVVLIVVTIGKYIIPVILGRYPLIRIIACLNIKQCRLILISVQRALSDPSASLSEIDANWSLLY